ncbi:MAG: hypothetical protein LBD07_00620 [Spirochaetaceae bacterium]|jgi:hypothetical protein|nr:hypothetical protein [Spirochaetaceae bacterium]
MVSSSGKKINSGGYGIFAGGCGDYANGCEFFWRKSSRPAADCYSN